MPLMPVMLVNPSARLSVVTSLSGLNSDGAEYIYNIATGPAGVPADGAFWHVKYIGAISKWVVLGGTMLVAMPGGSATAAGAAYATVAGTPTIAIPLNGTYDVWFGFEQASGNDTDIRASPDGAGTTSNDQWSAWGGQQAGGTTGNNNSPAAAMSFALTAGTLGWKVKRTQANNGVALNPWMVVNPKFVTA